MFFLIKHNLLKNVYRRYYSQCNKIRVRFAPSPTGFLHLGGLRTALYNYLFAKANSGAFILRIEDTDQTRLVDGAVEQLQNDLSWAGIRIDEGPFSGGDYGPYIQSQRLHIYSQHIKLLLDNGSAYHCFCTDKRLELLRKEALRTREIPKYDNRCRNLSRADVAQRLNNNEKSCIRFKLSSGAESFDDLIYGRITYDITANEGDPVIVKSDGYPTYHFANVVDDHCMQISHVLRGVEWQISTTKHILMYRAFNWQPPQFGHLPLLVNADGSKLSKRQGDIKIGNYRDTGIFPLALINFITNSGGGFDKDSEQSIKPQIYSIDELTKQFHISRINSHSGKLMVERLHHFNQLELKRQLSDPGTEKKLIAQLKEIVEKQFDGGGEQLDVDNNHIKTILNWAVNRITKLNDLVSNNFKFIWVSPGNQSMQSADELMVLDKFRRELSDDRLVWESKQKLNEFFKSFSKANRIKFGEFMRVLRCALSGLKEGPSVAEIMEILGREKSLERLEMSVKQLEKSKKQQMR